MNRRASTLVEDLVHHLRARLLAGAYAAGERISESGVATEYGVARPTARTALDILASEGLLEKNPFAAFSVPRIELADLAEILSLLTFLEARAAERITEVNPDLRDVRDGTTLSLHFFLDAVVRASESARLARVHRLTTFELLMGIAQAGIAEPEVPEDVRARMETAAGALWSKDPAAAGEALGHLQCWRAAVLSGATHQVS